MEGSLIRPVDARQCTPPSEHFSAQDPRDSRHQARLSGPLGAEPTPQPSPACGTHRTRAGARAGAGDRERKRWHTSCGRGRLTRRAGGGRARTALSLAARVGCRVRWPTRTWPADSDSLDVLRRERTHSQTHNIDTARHGQSDIDTH